jgi:hypothetical protein
MDRATALAKLLTAEELHHITNWMTDSEYAVNPNVQRLEDMLWEAFDQAVAAMDNIRPE